MSWGDCFDCDCGLPCPTHPPTSRDPSSDGTEKPPATADEPAPATTQDPRRRIWWPATDLMAADLPELTYAVPGILPEGLSVLAGAPKTGKSWWALAVAVAVASGGRALGSVPVEQGDALYVALEDGPRRLRDRLRTVLAGEPAPAGLNLVTAAPRIDNGLPDWIGRWVEYADRPRLIVVDVLARVRPVDNGRGSMYGADYAALAPLQAVAQERSLAVLVLHHVRKQGADDYVDRVSGTHGLAGAADAILVLARSRTRADATLDVVGRDIEEASYALTFDAAVGTWRLLGDARDYAMSEERQRILEAVREHEALRPKRISELTGLDHEVVKKLVVKMADAGHLDSDGQGTYLIPVPSVPSVPSLHVVGERGEQGERPSRGVPRDG